MPQIEKPLRGTWSSAGGEGEDIAECSKSMAVRRCEIRTSNAFGGRPKAEFLESGIESEEAESMEAGMAMRIPKGFRPKALGCELASYPGASRPKIAFNLNGVAPLSRNDA